MAYGAEGVWNVDWLNANSQRKYPLSEDATLVDTSNSFTLPNDFIVDMILPVHADNTVDPTLFHVAAVSIFGTGVSLALGYNGTIIGSVAIDGGTFTPNQTYVINCTGLFYDTVGKIVIGSLNTVFQSAGAFSFTVAQARLVPTVVKPDIRGVNSIQVNSNGNLSAPLQDDFVFQAGTNMLINVLPGVGGEPDKVVFSAIDGSQFSQGCDCDANTALPCIKTINGIPPNNSGDFTLLGDDCLLLDGIANGVKLTDQCAKPCCGCTELNIIQQTMEFMVSQVTSLENLASQLQQAILVTQTNLLSSKTNNLS